MIESVVWDILAILVAGSLTGLLGLNKVLEGLTAIVWSEFHHAYGEASDIPPILRRLTSYDPSEWVHAISKLYDSCCHQMCSVYSATPVVIGFLCELLDYPEIKCRGRILQYLADAACVGPDENHLENAGSIPDEVRLTREAVWSGLETYLELLSNLDERIRINVPYVLATLANEALQNSPPELFAETERVRITRLLKNHFEEEPNEFVQTSIVFALSSIGECENWLEQWLLTQLESQFRHVRLAASMCLAQFVDELPSFAIDILLEKLNDRETGKKLFDTGQPTIESKHHPIGKAMLEFEGKHVPNRDLDDINSREDFELPWSNRFSFNAKHGLLRCLVKSNVSEHQRMIPTLLQELNCANEFNVEDIVGPIKEILFPKGELNGKTARENLTEPQRQMLTSLFNNIGLWTTNYAHDMFELVGLGEHRRVWANLIGAKPPSDAEAAAMLKVILQSKHRFSEKELHFRRVGSPIFLGHIAKLKELTKLDLSLGQLANEDLQHLASMENLEVLLLNHVPIANSGVGHLLPLQRIRELYLLGTQVDDGVIPLLNQFPNLVYVHLARTGVSEEAVMGFKNEHPNCRVYH